MVQGEFTKEEGAEVNKTVADMFNGIPKSRRAEYIGHLNDISLFIEAAIRNAPNEVKKEGSGLSGTGNSPQAGHKD